MSFPQPFHSLFAAPVAKFEFLSPGNLMTILSSVRISSDQRWDRTGNLLIIIDKLIAVKVSSPDRNR